MDTRILSALTGLALLGGCASYDPARMPLAPGARLVDERTIAGERDFLAGIDPRTADGGVRGVVEIPAGRLDKWEVWEDGRMHWDVEDGQPRVVKYLGYPVNYGMVPRSVLAKQRGGDGDPLDLLVLGASLPRATVVEARVIGMIRLTDRGERDDKLLLVAAGTPFADVQDLGDLEVKFPGTTGILETWFAHYKGPGKLVPGGFADRAEALATLEQAIADYAGQAQGEAAAQRAVAERSAGAH